MIGAARADRALIANRHGTVVADGETGKIVTRLWNQGRVAGFREDGGAVALVGWDDEVGPALRYHDIASGGEVVEAIALADIDPSLTTEWVDVVPDPMAGLVHLRGPSGEWVQVRLVDDG